MAFAVFYNDEDAQAIAAAMNRVDLTNQERQLAQKLWQGGLNNWQTAPFGLYPNADVRCCAPNSSRKITINASGVTKTDMVTLLNQIGTRVGGVVGGYLTTLAIDVNVNGLEPA